MSKLSTEIAALLNTHSRENASDTPDFILAEYLMACLEAFELAVCRRESWYDRPAPDADPRPEAPVVKAPEDAPGPARTINHYVSTLCASCSPPQQVARTREAQVAKLQAKRKAQKPLKLRGVPCPDCHGGGGTRCGTQPCARCGGTGEIL